MEFEEEVAKEITPELQQLVTAVIEGRITQPQWNRLEQLLFESEEARNYYMSEIDLAAGLWFLFQTAEKPGRLLTYPFVGERGHASYCY